MENSYAIVVKRLIKYRIEKGYSQEEMAQMLGLTQSHYSKIELLKKVITNDTLLKMHEIGMDIDYLVTGKETKHTELDNLLDKCPLSRKSIFMNIVISYMNVLLKKSGCKLLFCERELEILKFHVDKDNGQNCGTVWKHIRKLHNISQAEMTRFLDIDFKTYRKIEKGTTMPNVQILTNLYNELGYYPTLVENIESNYLFTLNHVWIELSKESQRKVEDIVEYNLDYMNDNL